MIQIIQIIKVNIIPNKKVLFSLFVTFNKICMGVGTFGQFTFRQLAFRQFTFRQITFCQFTFRQLTFCQFTFRQLTFRQFTYRQPDIWSITTFSQLLPNVNWYILSYYIWSTHTNTNIVGQFWFTGCLHLYIYLDIVYGIIVQIKLTDNSPPLRPNKKSLLTDSSSIVL